MKNENRLDVILETTKTVAESEGFRPSVYLDSLGNPTIGIGFLTTSMTWYDWEVLGAPINSYGFGLHSSFNTATFTTTMEKSVILLDVKLHTILDAMLAAQPWIENESNNTIEVLLDMSYNMGVGWFAKFPKTISLIREGDYVGASKEMLDSLWARQVKSRAVRLSEKMANSGPKQADVAEW